MLNSNILPTEIKIDETPQVIEESPQDDLICNFKFDLFI